MRRSRPPSPARARPQSSDLGPLSGYIGFQLRRAQDMSFQAFARRAGKLNLRPGLFAILSLIHENPGINQTALSIATGRDKSTLTPALRDLARRGLVRRDRARHDQRAWALTLTAAGRTHLELLARHAAAHDELLDSIIGRERKPAFIALLERLVIGLTEHSAGRRR